VVEIVTGFMLDSPPGQLKEVVKDVRSLISDESILNQFALPTFKAWNAEHMVHVQPNKKSTHTLLITPFGELRGGEYLDPRNKQMVVFDHIRQEVTSVRSASSSDLPSEVEPYRAALDARVQEYVEEHFPYGASVVYGKKSGAQFMVSVCISSTHYTPKNYWSGDWRSNWHLSFAPSAAPEVNLEGKVKVNVHYYEAGNVQMSSEWPKQFKFRCPSGNPDDFADAAINSIVHTESKFHASLEEDYNTMGDTTFKALRRQLPISRSKIDWGKISQYKIGTDVKFYTTD